MRNLVSPASGHRTCASDGHTCCRQMRLMVCMNILGVITNSRSASSAVMSWLPSTCCANISCNARPTAHFTFLYQRPTNVKLLARVGLLLAIVQSSNAVLSERSSSAAHILREVHM